MSVGLAAAEQYGWPVKAEEACPMDWDATSYTSAPHCIRRFDRDLTVADKRDEVHFDGQIWSQALWEIRQGYPGLGFTTADWDRTLVDSQFDYAADTSFSAAAKATYAKALANQGAGRGRAGQGPVRRPRHHLLTGSSRVENTPRALRGARRVLYSRPLRQVGSGPGRWSGSRR